MTRKLGVSWILSDLSLGQVWGVDLMKNEVIVKDVIWVAQGEMALEEFLKQVRITNNILGYTNNILVIY